MNILLQGDIAANARHHLKAHADADWVLNTWDPQKDDLASFTALAYQANVIVGGNIPTEQWPAVPALKLFQIPWAGHNFTSPERIARGVPVANCFEHESAIAEYVLLSMLEMEIGISKMDRQFRKSGWAGRVVGSSGGYHGEILGKTLGIIGYGHIGEAVAKRAAAFEMNIIGVKRTAMETPPPLSWLGTPDQLDKLLQESDFVLIACDLNDATKDLINRQTLTAMKNTAVVINVSRGGVIEEPALYDALSSGRIGGAVIDVWYNYNDPNLGTASGIQEVWPSNHPFHELDNTLLTAHESGWTRAQVNRRWQFVAENIRCIANRKTPKNIVFTGTAGTA